MDLELKEELRERMQKELKENICTVKFTKADGTERIMECTLIPEELPPPRVLAEGVKVIKRAPNPATLSVWDMKAEGWRSFRIDSVNDFTSGE